MPLYLLPTPIGNFDDITLRTLDTLKNCDVIFCEDTRVTNRLINHFDIKKPLFSYQNFNEEEASEKIITLLKDQQHVVLCSDAGMPLISDPGYVVVQKAITKNLEVIALPGANAALTALVVSGLKVNAFLFKGFLSYKKSKRLDELTKIKNVDATLIFYEAPHRLFSTLESLLEVLGPRKVVICRELTKVHETIYRTRLNEIEKEKIILKGEFVILVEYESFLQDAPVDELFNTFLNETKNVDLALKKTAKIKKISKSELYKKIKLNK